MAQLLDENPTGQAWTNIQTLGIYMPKYEAMQSSQAVRGLVKTLTWWGGLVNASLCLCRSRDGA